MPRFEARPGSDREGFVVGRLTTHVLDTAHGRPAAGVALELWSVGETPEKIKATVTITLTPRKKAQKKRTLVFELASDSLGHWRICKADPPEAM